MKNRQFVVIICIIAKALKQTINRNNHEHFSAKFHNRDSHSYANQPYHDPLKKIDIIYLISSLASL